MFNRVFLDVVKRRMTPSRYMKDVFKIYIDKSDKTDVVLVMKYNNVAKLRSTEMAIKRMFGDIDDIHVSVKPKGKLFTYGVSNNSVVMYEQGVWQNVI